MGASDQIDNCNLLNTCHMRCNFPWYCSKDIWLRNLLSSTTMNRLTIQQALILCYLKSAKNTGLLQPVKRFENGRENLTHTSIGGTRRLYTDHSSTSEDPFKVYLSSLRPNSSGLCWVFSPLYKDEACAIRKGGYACSPVFQLVPFI